MPTIETLSKAAALALVLAVLWAIGAPTPGMAAKCRYKDSSGTEQCTEKASAVYVCCRKYAGCSRGVCRTRRADCKAFLQFDTKGSCSKAKLSPQSIRPAEESPALQLEKDAKPALKVAPVKQPETQQ